MIVTIVLLLYICLLCVPAFFFTYEKNGPIDIFEGCQVAICVILGFPGAILGFLIRGNIDARNQAQYEESERQRRIAAHEQAQKTALLRTKRIGYYAKSSLLPEVIKFVTRHGTPYDIFVNTSGISVSRLNGHDHNIGIYKYTYVFVENGIENLADNNVEVYALGHAINNALGNHFTIIECHNDGKVSAVTLERPLQRF